MKISDKEILNKKPANLRSLKWGEILDVMPANVYGRERKKGYVIMRITGGREVKFKYAFFV